MRTQANNPHSLILFNDMRLPISAHGKFPGRLLRQAPRLIYCTAK